MFLLEGANGLTLIESLSKEIQDRASEWRALPNLPDSPVKVATDLLAATQKDGETADSLRKTDGLTMRRAGFAIKLRDFEAYERDLPPDAWADYRHAFFQAIIQHILVLPAFFELEIYVPRIIRLAVACEDYQFLQKIILAIKELIENVRNDCLLKVKSCDDVIADDVIDKIWVKKLFQAIEENIKAAFPYRLSHKGKTGWNKNFIENQGVLEFDCSIETMSNVQSSLFSYDLAHIPFRYIKLPKEFVDQRLVPPQKSILQCEVFREIVDHNITDGLSHLIKWLRLKKTDGIPYGLLFPTRPFSLTDLSFLRTDPYKNGDSQNIDKIMLALRGYPVSEKMPTKEDVTLIPFKSKDNQKKIKIALGSWKTKGSSWKASVLKQKEPDLTRYKRLTDLINNLLSHTKGVRYFVMPELSIPVRWYMRIVKKFLDSRVSLISGVEYLHCRTKSVRNQVWAALWYDALGYPSTAIIRQDKQRPAYHEGIKLKELAGLEYKPAIKWKTPPLIRHGNFQFGMVVCSELTNISYRSALRGQIDALIVPEWNQDIASFNALVESAALDIHTFIVQCNDRQFGDSRIRAPYKNNWERDIIRIRGGITDYFVIGEIDIEELRSFQSHAKYPDEPFKPVPDGFTIAPERKTKITKKETTINQKDRFI